MKLKTLATGLALAATLGLSGSALANTMTVAPKSVTELEFIPGPFDGQPAIPLGLHTWDGGGAMALCKTQIVADKAVPRPYPRYYLCIRTSVQPATPQSEDDRATLFGGVLNELNGD